MPFRIQNRYLVMNKTIQAGSFDIITVYLWEALA
jgi:hypothetical protein